MLEKVLCLYDSAFTLDEKLQQVEFFRLQRNFSTLEKGFVLIGVDNKATGLELVADDSLWPAQQRFDACQKLSDFEWFGEIVVGSGLESFFFLLYPTFTSQHQYWR